MKETETNNQGSVQENGVLLTVEEMARELRVSPNTIYYWVHRKEIPYLKVGRHLRFRREAVVAFFEHKTGPRVPCRPLSELVKPKPWFGEKPLRAGSLKTEEGALLKLKRE